VEPPDARHPIRRQAYWDGPRRATCRAARRGVVQCLSCMVGHESRPSCRGGHRGGPGDAGDGVAGRRAPKPGLGPGDCRTGWGSRPTRSSGVAGSMPTSGDAAWSSSFPPTPDHRQAFALAGRYKLQRIRDSSPAGRAQGMPPRPQSLNGSRSSSGRLTRPHCTSGLDERRGRIHRGDRTRSHGHPRWTIQTARSPCFRGHGDASRSGAPGPLERRHHGALRRARRLIRIGPRENLTMTAHAAGLAVPRLSPVGVQAWVQIRG
jgi:hypothetical protein